MRGGISNVMYKHLSWPMSNDDTADINDLFLKAYNLWKC